VKTARLRGIFLVQPGTNGSFTEQSSGSFTTKTGGASLFLETIITSVLTRKLSAIANISLTTSQSQSSGRLARCYKRRANQAGFWQYVKYRFLL
jgi:hypothetical protein